jgi:hypothetical protein
MKVKMLIAIALSGLLAASFVTAASATNGDINQPSMQTADDAAGNTDGMSGSTGSDNLSDNSNDDMSSANSNSNDDMSADTATGDDDY